MPGFKLPGRAASPMIRRHLPVALALCATLLGGSALAQAKDDHPSAKSDTTGDDKESLSPRHLSDESQLTQGSITVGGRKVTYQAEAGVLVIHQKDPLDDDPPPP